MSEIVQEYLSLKAISSNSDDSTIRVVGVVCQVLLDAQDNGYNQISVEPKEIKAQNDKIENFIELKTYLISKIGVLEACFIIVKNLNLSCKILVYLEK